MVVDQLSIKDRTFRLTLCEDGPSGWHWMLAAPGELLLSGEAASQDLAVEEARAAGRFWAETRVGGIRPEPDSDAAPI
jgi:hypothetical protein